MAEQHSTAGSERDRDDATGQPGVMGGRVVAPAGTPRWVKVFAIVAAVVLVLIVVMVLTGHGPGRHMHGLGGHATAVAGAAALSGRSR